MYIHLFSSYCELSLKDTKVTVIRTRLICCHVGTSPDIFTWITSTRFSTQSTVEAGRTILVAIYTVCPGPIFLKDRMNILYRNAPLDTWKNKEIDKCPIILNKILFTNTGISNNSIILTTLYMQFKH